MKDWIKILIALIGIFAGLLAIFTITELELAIGLISLTFGILAIIWVSRARKSLSKGSSLKEYATIFMYCLILVLAYSVWETLEGLLLWTDLLVYPKYFFISAAYLLFVYAAYKMLRMSREFGFEAESKKIAKLIKKKKTERKK